MPELGGVGHAFSAQRQLERDFPARKKVTHLFRIAVRDAQLWEARLKLQGVALCAVLLVFHGLEKGAVSARPMAVRAV